MSRSEATGRHPHSRPAGRWRAVQLVATSVAMVAVGTGVSRSLADNPSAEPERSSWSSPVRSPQALRMTDSQRVDMLPKISQQDQSGSEEWVEVPESGRGTFDVATTPVRTPTHRVHSSSPTRWRSRPASPTSPQQRRPSSTRSSTTHVAGALRAIVLSTGLPKTATSVLCSRRRTPPTSSARHCAPGAKCHAATVSSSCSTPADGRSARTTTKEHFRSTVPTSSITKWATRSATAMSGVPATGSQRPSCSSRPSG